MSTKIAAIETRYAGCRFRSRLEARWAVFFDHLGIKWEYEPQGYLVGPDKRPYLPDFRLPELGSFVEAKGVVEKLDLGLLAEIVSHPIAETGVHSMLILGQVPTCEEGAVPVHAKLEMVWDFRYSGGAWDDTPPIGDRDQMFTLLDSPDEPAKTTIRRVWDHEKRTPIVVQPVAFLPTTKGVRLLSVAGPELCPTTDDVLDPGHAWHLRLFPKVQAAYEAARSARFEHGETP
jgi:hypothetical protein